MVYYPHTHRIVQEDRMNPLTANPLNADERSVYRDAKARGASDEEAMAEVRQYRAANAITEQVAPTVAPTDADRWVAGWNMPGYSPDPDNVTPFAEWEDARQYIVETIDYFWDQNAYSDQDEDAIEATWLPIHTDIHSATPDQEWGYTIDSANLTFWITQAER